jgi:hypothetical protein
VRGSVGPGPVRDHFADHEPAGTAAVRAVRVGSAPRSPQEHSVRRSRGAIRPEISMFHVKHRPRPVIPASSREAVSEAYRAP